jgi:hypothetical protein
MKKIMRSSSTLLRKMEMSMILCGILSIIGMMRKILHNSTDHNLNTTKFPKSSDLMCIACATRKLIMRPSPLKIQVEPLKFLERIQGDICGLIQPLSGSFKYFMVLIDASMWWSHLCLPSTHNHTFAKFMTLVIRLKENLPITYWGHVVLHAADLIQLRPTAYHSTSPL